MARTNIEWAEYSWNPVVGCSKVSEGCQNCYAERMAYRLAHIGRATGNIRLYNKYAPVLNGHGGWNGKINVDSNVLEDPLRLHKSKVIFVCSMSDLFHEAVAMETIWATFDIMRRATHHYFVLLTKRPQRMLEVCQQYNLKWPENVWAGVTCETQQRANERLPILMEIPAAIRLVSLEPMLSKINLSLCIDCQVVEPWNCHEHNKLDWVIMGAESGPRRRPMDVQWAKNIAQQCVYADVPLFYKQGPSDDEAWSKMPVLFDIVWSQKPEVTR
jgi:protein gp37